MPDARLVDVIVPVYRGAAETRRSLESVLGQAQATPFELVLVDDATPEPALAGYLDEVAARPGVTLLRNRENQGFVRSANRGMALHPERDVVLLNSDTEVANDWLDRLVRCLRREDDCGTATPFSNNATICSYPYEGWAGGVPGTLGLATLDRVFAATNAGLAADLPTAVGFCMAIRRACLAAVGPFDAERFGRGYGEENDFCLRAAAAGWRHVLAADVFVFHAGGVSFSAEREALQRNAMAVLLAAHPEYLERVRDFQARDPLAPLRAAVDRARGWHGPAESRALLDERSARRGPPPPPRPALLHIAHDWGGGIERWITDFRTADRSRRHLLLRSRSERNFAAWRLELLEPAVSDIPLLAWNLEAPIRATAITHAEYRSILHGIVSTFGVQGLLLSSLIGHSLEALDTGLPSVLVLHDLYPYCPALFGFFDGPCVTCADDRLHACLRRNPLNAFWHNTGAEDWQALRAAYGERLGRRDIRIAAPTRSVRERWATLLPVLADLPWQCLPHGLDLASLGSGADGGHVPAPAPGRLRLVLPGRLLPHKGLALLHEMLPELRPFADLYLLGCGEFGKSFEGLPGVAVIPHYAPADLARHIAEIAPDCALLLSTLPESFSYTLSEMFALRVPVVATRLGAFAERIEAGVNGLLVEPQAAALLATLRALAGDRTRLEGLRANLARQAVTSVEAMVQAYHALLPAAAAAAVSLGDRGLTEAVIRQGELEREVAWFREEYRRKTERLAAQREESEGLRLRAERLQAECAALRRSTSWRLTAPLRAVTRILRPRPDKAAIAPAQAPTGGVMPTGTLFIPPAGERAQARRRLRHDLGLPDRSRLLLVYGAPATDAEAGRLTRLVESCLAARNDSCVLWPGAGLEALAWRDVMESWRVLASRRRLFFLPEATLAGDVLGAVDVLIEPGNGDAAIAARARDLGLPVLTLGEAADTPEALAAMVGGWLDGAANDGRRGCPR